MNIREEAFVIEHATNSAIEAMHAWIVAGQLSARQALPEVDMLAALGIWRLAREHPSVRALAVRAYAAVGIEAET